MKKRLSDSSWEITAIILAFFILFIILTFSLRTVMMSGSYGQIPLEIPVVSVIPKDPGFHGFEERPRDLVRNTTPAIVMTSDAFYFGALDSFSQNLMDSSNKFSIPHIDGIPQVQTLKRSFEEWLKSRSKTENIPLPKSLVLIPSGEIPLPIVIQVVAGLRDSGMIHNVILSNGLI